MGSVAAEAEASSIPKLPLLTLPPMQSPEHRSGMLTPPLNPSAAVPFRWEEHPGKPHPCTALINTSTNSSLELPPRLQSKMTKTPSPTAVLDGPYIPVFQSSSFRFTERAVLSFGRSGGGGSPERGQLGSMVHGKRGLFGSWGRKGNTTNLVKGGKRGRGRGSFVYSSSMDIANFGDDENDGSRFRRNGSLSQARPHFWATIYDTFKQVLPWSKKTKKDGPVI
ncbi:Uncharacterized protein LOK49_LG03G02089 [Camellia lanceoleosa]|uniref:Uncharacterized protein n=1 Tax=Camellia lanceoleosa TaxID=1840588 RepID=A0ACC0IAX9_9ERIC|nr:Uncharacterized protein LOK49_LG03G02089 [Camellia lanceoleosa]